MGAILLGFMIGSMIGSLGVGGGALMTPLLILLFRLQASVAVSTDLLYMAITKSFGALQHWRQGTLQRPLAVRLVLGGLLGSTASPLLALHLARGSQLDAVMRPLLAAALVVASILLIGAKGAKLASLPSLTLPIPFDASRSLPTILLGLSVGSLMGITSVGGGAILLPLLTLLYGLDPKKLVGTSIFFSAIVSSIAALTYLGSIGIDPWVLAYLLFGALPGVWLGSKLNHLAPERLVRWAIALLLIGLALPLAMG